MGKTSSAVKQRYNEKAYDRLAITIPKGRKLTVEARAKQDGESINGFVNALLRDACGLTEAEWKQPPAAADQLEEDPQAK